MELPLLVSVNTNFAILLVLTFAFLILAVAVHRLYLHPLSRIPGPGLWIVSRLPYIHALRSGKLAVRLKELHDYYGPVVRVAYNEVSFASEEAWSAFYASRNTSLPKSPYWHKPRVTNDSTGIMSSSSVDHARFRRALAPAFTQRALNEREMLFQRHSSLLLEQLRQQAAKSEPVNVLDWVDYAAFDTASEFSLGTSFCSLQNPEHRGLVHTLRKFLTAFTQAVVPQLLGMQAVWTYIVPTVSRKQYMSYSKSLNDWTHERYDREGIPGRSDLMTYITSRVKEKGLTFTEMENAIGDVIVAGSETVSTTLCSIVYHLIRHTDIQEKLAAELRSNFESEVEIRPPELENMKLLNAVIHESMRLCPSLPMVLPRIMTDPGMQVCGYWLPPKTLVSFCQFAAYHSDRNFGSPEEFIPQRWLPNSKIQPHNDGIFHPFSIGPRDCIGKLVGLTEVRLILAKLLWNFDVSAVGEQWSWYDQRTYFAWDKRPLEVRLTATDP